MARTRSFVALVVLLLATLAACGAEDSPSIDSPTTSTTTPASTGG